MTKIFTALLGVGFVFTIAFGCSSEGGDNARDTTAADDSDSTGDSEVTELSICQRMIECARAINTAGITALIEVYGDEGTCWEVAGATEEDCHRECIAILEPFGQANPNESICSQCATDADCALHGLPYCHQNTGDCAETLCGNGAIDDGETCDPGLSDECDTDCIDRCNECNPLSETNGCASNERCSVGIVNPNNTGEKLGGVCLEAGAATQGETCSTEINCAPGYVCTGAETLPGCASEACCTRFCDLSGGDCPDSLPCSVLQAALTGWDLCSGIENVGFCGNE